MSSYPSTSIASPRPDLQLGTERFDSIANRSNMVGLQLMPVITVAAKFGQFGKVDIGELLKKNVDARRSAGAAYRAISGRFSKDSYACTEYGLIEPIDDDEAATWGAWINAEMLATTRLVNQLVEAHEARVVTAVDAISNSTALSTDWLQTNATPVTDLLAIKETVRMRCGRVPNALCIEHKVFQYLINNAEVIDRLNSSGAGRATAAGEMNKELLAIALDLDEVIVAGGLKNTAADGSAVSLATLWTQNNGLLFVKDSTNDFSRPRWGNTLVWSEQIPGAGDLIQSAGMQAQPTIERYRDETLRSDVIRARWYTTEKVMWSECAQLITNCV